MKKHHALCLSLSLILTASLTSSAFACTACSVKSPVNYKKGLQQKGKAVKVYGGLFLSEEQLLLTEISEMPPEEPQNIDESINILPALYYVLSDKLVIKAVYNKFILPVSPEETRTPRPEPSDSLTVGLDFKF